MLNLHVIFAIDRAGLVGEDGETHHGIYDVGFLRHAPGLTLLAPASRKELEKMLVWAVEEQTGPVAIRYPRGGDRGFEDCLWDAKNSVVTHRRGDDVTLITYGVLLNNVIKAAELLSENGIEATVLRLTRLSELPVDVITKSLSANKHVVVLEEISGQCGICQELTYELQKSWPECRVSGIDLGKRYVSHGNVNTLYEHYGLSPEAIKDYVMEAHHSEN